LERATRRDGKQGATHTKRKRAGKDPDVSLDHLLKTMEAIKSPDVVLNIVKDGNYDLDRETDLDFMISQVKQML